VHRLTRRVARIIASNALIAMRGMKHAQRDRNKLDEARQRRTRLLRTGNWNSRGRAAHPTVLPIPILQLSLAAVVSKSQRCRKQKYAPHGRGLFWRFDC
jgi:hypothetical protein